MSLVYTFLCGMYQGKELLGYRVCIHSALADTAKWFCKVAIPVHAPNTVWADPQPLQHLILLVFFILAILVNVV